MLLGIDIGTQSLKAALTDSALSLRGFGQQPYEVQFSQPGWAEQDPGIWEGALAPAIAQALAAAGVEASDIQGIGLCGQLDGCLPVDGDCEPLGPCLIWMDRRAQGQIDDAFAELIHKRTGIVADAAHLAAKICWLKRNGGQARCFHQPVSYLVERLTGRRRIDHALASTSMLYGLRTQRYEPELLALFGIAEQELPELAEAQNCAGPLLARGAALTGLRAGIPVAVGTGDDFASPLGAGVTDSSVVSVAVGTGEVVGRRMSEAIIDASRLVETHAFPAGGYFTENPGWLAGGAVAWLMRVLGLRDFAQFDALAAAAPIGAGGLLFLPALTGAMAPQWIADARGCFYGLTPAHGPGHLARALLEGCAFAMRDVLDSLRVMGPTPREIVFSGGGSRSRLWAQIRADAAGLPIAIVASPHAAVIGAAMLAGVAAGIFGSLAEAQALLPMPAERVVPDSEAQHLLDASHGRYRALFSALKPIFASPA
jgi:xylulokinase